MYQFADRFYVKFRNNATAFGKISQLLCSGKYFSNQTFSNSRHLLSGVPIKNILKIT